MRAEVNTRGKTSIKLAAGQFTGTVEAQSIQLNGTLDFTPATPVYDLHISLRGCNPNSLDVGMKLDDLADATAHITGQLPKPVLDGVLMFPKLHMPGNSPMSRAPSTMRTACSRPRMSRQMPMTARSRPKDISILMKKHGAWI